MRGRGATIAVAVMSTAVVGAAAPAFAEPTAEDGERLRATIEERVVREVGTTAAGAAVAVVDADGPLLMEVWGEADPVAGIAMTLEARMPVGSVSKVVTALTALTLHHDGVLDLDAEVAELTGVEPTDRRDPAVRTPVTGRQLLTHHAGIEESLVVLPQPLEADPDEAAGPLGPWLAARPPVLRHPSDLGLHYSPLQGYALLGAGVEQATGRSFDDVVTERVLQPVGATTARFDAVGEPAAGDVLLAVREPDGWVPRPWPALRERPATTLAWSVQDAAALLEALLADDGRLPTAVVEEATTTAVRPAHGGDGHTQVFFESWRSEVRVLEHAGANGLAWFALLPEAGLGVFAAVTSETEDAAGVTPRVVDDVARWAVSTGLAERDPAPEAGRETLRPPWAQHGTPVAPVGTFHQRVFPGRGPELPLRTVTGQVEVHADGDDLLVNGRRHHPVGDGRWCADAGRCIAGLEASDGTVVLLRGDQGMLEQTLTPAPWWADTRFVVGALVAAAFAVQAVLAGAIRAGWRRLRKREPIDSVSRPLGAVWGAGFGLAAVGTPLVVIWPLLGNSLSWVPTRAPVLVVLQLATVASLVAGVIWVARALRNLGSLSWSRRGATAVVALAGAAGQLVVLTWLLPAP